MARAANYHDGACGVVDAVLADRAQQGPGQAAVPAVADYQQVSPCGRIQEHSGRVSLHHARPDYWRICRRCRNLGDS